MFSRKKKLMKVWRMKRDKKKKNWNSMKLSNLVEIKEYKKEEIFELK